MGKGRTKGNSSLGKSIIKARFKHSSHTGDSFMHVSELDDGFEWTKHSLQSVTDPSQLDDFLATAQLANDEFDEETRNIKIVESHQYTGILSEKQEKLEREKHELFKHLLRIPKRPAWEVGESKEELESKERASFLSWRRDLASLDESNELILTPYEKNLEVWRQLWRVVERSHLIVQIVDARNPLKFWCEDLEDYTRSIDSSKHCLLLVNKADFFSEKQRLIWAQFFVRANMEVVFWSAIVEKERQEKFSLQSISEESAEPLEKDFSAASSSASEVKGGSDIDVIDSDKLKDDSSSGNTNEGNVDSNKAVEVTHEMYKQWRETGHILNKDELLALFQFLILDRKKDDAVSTVGLIGYPNVGKSSTINSLLEKKKVSVSATPGKTKHFQTLYVSPKLLLCDCPGLVMPAFAMTKAEMVLNGILPVDQMRDQIGPANLLCQLIPRRLLEKLYGINIPPPADDEDPNRPPTAIEMLSAHAYMRGYVTSQGQPDTQRSARVVIKDFLKGKLTYVWPPPDVDGETFSENVVPLEVEIELQRRVLASTNVGGIQRQLVRKSVSRKVDSDFFVERMIPGVGTKSRLTPLMAAKRSALLAQSKKSKHDSMGKDETGKSFKHHNNANKREKLRRLYPELDPKWA